MVCEIMDFSFKSCKILTKDSEEIVHEMASESFMLLRRLPQPRYSIQ